MRKGVLILLLVSLILSLLSWLVILRLSTNAIKPTPAGDLKTITVGVTDSPSARYAGEYVADRSDAYANDGLKVNFNLISSANLRGKILSGEYQFGLMTADALLQARSEGAPLVAVFVTYSSNPIVVYVRSDSGIASVNDLVGHRVAIRATDMVAFQMALREYNIPPDSIQMVIRGNDTDASVSAGDYEAFVAWASETFSPQLASFGPMDKLDLSEFARRDYADVIVTTEDYIRRQPDDVRNFVVATRDGWRQALADEQLAVQGVRFYDTTATGMQVSGALSALKPFIAYTANSSIGDSSFTDWRRIYEQVKKIGLIKNDFDVTAAYNMSFLP